MSRLKKLLRKADKIVENIDTDYLLKKIEEDEKQEQEYELYFDEISAIFNDELINNKYINYSSKSKLYIEYNYYEVGEEKWTSIKAS